MVTCRNSVVRLLCKQATNDGRAPEIPLRHRTRCRTGSLEGSRTIATPRPSGQRLTLASVRQLRPAPSRTSRICPRPSCPPTPPPSNGHTMDTTEYLAAINAPGTNVIGVEWASEVRPAAAHKARVLRKVTTAVAMTGVEYANLSANNERETGPLPWGTVVPLPVRDRAQGHRSTSGSTRSTGASARSIWSTVTWYGGTSSCPTSPLPSAARHARTRAVSRSRPRTSAWSGSPASRTDQAPRTRERSRKRTGAGHGRDADARQATTDVYAAHRPRRLVSVGTVWYAYTVSNRRRTARCPTLPPPSPRAPIPSAGPARTTAAPTATPLRRGRLVLIEARLLVHLMS